MINDYTIIRRDDSFFEDSKCSLGPYNNCQRTGTVPALRTSTVGAFSRGEGGVF